MQLKICIKRSLAHILCSHAKKRCNFKQRECKYSPIIRLFRRCPIISGYLYRMLTADGKDSGR
ncbi:Uncharacterised protein [Klebsiella pneumoniae]|nr:Uncharacterised protein [Klebsiella pneumoniae]